MTRRDSDHELPLRDQHGIQQEAQMRKKLIGIPLAGLLLVGGATAVLAQSGAGAGVIQAATAPGTPIGAAGTILSDVLENLVGDGTINQQQADAITKAVEDRKTELRDQAQKLREQMRTFLEDGTLSADELAQLPEDNPLRHLDQFLDDGQLTQDELRQLRGLGHFGHGPGRGHGPFGPGPEDKGQDNPNAPASPAPSAPTS
jgi:hypothetical protein